MTTRGAPSSGSGGAAGTGGAFVLDVEDEPRFPRIRREAYRPVARQDRETTLIVVTWGPRLDVLFHPNNAPGIAGGILRVYGRTPGGQFEITRATIANPAAPMLLTASAACDHYVVTAVLGAAPPAGAKSIETYVFACAYADRA